MPRSTPRIPMGRRGKENPGRTTVQHYPANWQPSAMDDCQVTLVGFATKVQCHQNIRLIVSRADGSKSVVSPVMFPRIQVTIPSKNSRTAFLAPGSRAAL